MKIMINVCKLDTTKADSDTMWILPDGTQVSLDSNGYAELLDGDQPVVSSVAMKVGSFDKLVQIVPIKEIQKMICLNLNDDQLDFLAVNSSKEALLHMADCTSSRDCAVVEICAKWLCKRLNVDRDAYRYYEDLLNAFKRVIENQPKWIIINYEDELMEFKDDDDDLDIDLISEVWNDVVWQMDNGITDKLGKCWDLDYNEKDEYLRAYLKIAPNDIFVTYNSYR